MKYKKIILSSIFFIAFILLFNSKVYASDLELKNLDYAVSLNSNGTASITETWDISIENTNTLFKTFEIDKTKYSGIENISVTEITNNNKKSFSQIYSEKYHVDKNCFYAFKNSDGKFEIAWGVNEDDSYSRRKFKISYTIIDAIKNYADCSEFYWQFINTESAIPANNVTGTITLPASVSNLEDFRVWAHGPLNGNITKISDNTAKFDISNLAKRTMLETRVVTPPNIFVDNKNISSNSKLNSILAQEQQWADEANAKREAYSRNQFMKKVLITILFIGTNIAGIILAIFLIKKIKKYKETLEKAPNYAPTMPSKYYRDIPDEKESPAGASLLYYFKTSSIELHISEVISATMLDLCMKKYIEFNVNPDDSKNIKIKLTPDMDKNNLPESEKTVYELLDKVSSSKEFTIKEFEKYCKSHTTSFQSSYNAIPKKAKNEEQKLENYDKELINTYNDWSGKGVGYIFLAILSCIFMLAAIIPAIILAVYSFKISSRYNTLTQQGIDKKEAWTGLKNYMEDFSMMNEKEVPELVLWEKYLVYATAFGIADKVLKQLKVIYPQLLDENYMLSNGYSYLYWMSFSNMNFINTINHSITNTYNSVNYSSGSGGGGGFSGGGGFGGGGGRNGRKIKNYYCIILSFVIVYIL